MIGTPIQATLWRVAYRYRKATEDPSPNMLEAGPLAGVASESAVVAIFGQPVPEPATTYRSGQVLVVTADTTGADLLPVVERVLAAAGVRGTEFALVAVERMADTIRGLALLEGGAS
jgi:hypothetical protein